jgi:multidrug efflux system membrane fusion protein
MNDYVAADIEQSGRAEPISRDTSFPGAPVGPSRKVKKRRRRWLWSAVLLLGGGALVLVGYRPDLLPDLTKTYSAFLSKETKPAAAEGRSPAAVPVHVAVVSTRDVPVYLSGLGSVQATNSVIVRSRVDGQIEKIAFEEGQLVHEGDLLVQIDPAPFKAALDQATAKLAQDEANLEISKKELSRTETLAKQGWATAELRDQRDSAVAQLTAQVKADKAAIESAQVQLNYTTIRSPLTGQAGFRLVDRGNIIQAGDPRGVLTITQIEPISVIFTAPEQQLPNIQEPLRNGPLKVLAYTSDGRTLLGEGKLMLIDNQVDMASGTLRLKASFPNADRRLWPGLSVSTRLLITTLKNVVAVPDIAVQRGPNGLFAYVIDKDGRAEVRHLEVGPITDGVAVIEKGVAAGEQIVTAGHYRLYPQAMVSIVADNDKGKAETPEKKDRKAGWATRTEVD